jgi:hypothetical protein
MSARCRARIPTADPHPNALPPAPQRTAGPASQPPTRTPTRCLPHPSELPARIRAWLAKNSADQHQFTPTNASRMNMVEIFFGIITRQAIHRGTFTSVADLTAAIRAFIDGYNQRCEPFRWAKTAEQTLTKADRQKTSDTRHKAHPFTCRRRAFQHCWLARRCALEFERKSFS